MTESQILSASMMEFPKYAELPVELRLHVIEEAIKDIPNLRRQPKARLASVNSEWNQAIERVLFREIEICHGEIEDFGRVCGKRRNLLDHICLNLDHCRQSAWDSISSSSDAISSSEMVTQKVSELFHILKDWSRAERPHRLITLSIRVLNRNSNLDEVWALESSHCYFSDLPEVAVIGILFTREWFGDRYHLHHSAIDALHKKLPNLHGASIALPSGVPLQATIDIANSRIIATHDTKPSLTMLSIVQDPLESPHVPSLPDFKIRDRSDEITMAETLTPSISLWSETLVCLKLDCVIDIPQFLLTASKLIWPNLETMDLLGVLDQDDCDKTYGPGSLDPEKEYRACTEYVRGLVAAFPGMRNLTKLDVRFRDPTTDECACCLRMDLGTRINTERLVWQPTPFSNISPFSAGCTFEDERAVMPCCPLMAEDGKMIARDVVLPGQLVTEFQDTVWQSRHRKVTVICCRDDTYRSPLPCTRWNRERNRWDFAFNNDMDVFIWQMGYLWDELYAWDEWKDRFSMREARLQDDDFIPVVASGADW